MPCGYLFKPHLLKYLYPSHGLLCQNNKDILSLETGFLIGLCSLVKNGNLSAVEGAKNEDNRIGLRNIHRRSRYRL